MDRVCGGGRGGEKNGVMVRFHSREVLDKAIRKKGEPFLVAKDPIKALKNHIAIWSLVPPCILWSREPKISERAAVNDSLKKMCSRRGNRSTTPFFIRR